MKLHDTLLGLETRYFESTFILNEMIYSHTMTQMIKDYFSQHNFFSLNFVSSERMSHKSRTEGEIVTIFKY